MRQAMASVNNQAIFPRVFVSNKAKKSSPTMSAAINQEALPLRILTMISIQSIFSFLISTFEMPISVVNMKYGTNNDLTMAIAFFFRLNDSGR